MAGEILSQLPADLQTNEAFTGMNTAGDLAKAYLDTKGKVNEFDGKVKTYEGKIGDLEKRLGDSIPKQLPENATDEQKATFYKERGVPEKPEEYEFPYPEGVSPDKLSPQDKELHERVVRWAQKMFHANHATKEQAAGMTKELSVFSAALEKEINIQKAEALKQEITAASEKLKTELGDKYDAGIELATRFWRKHSDLDFDKVFDRETNPNRYQMVSFLIKVAKLTGEDLSPHGAPLGGTKESDWYPKTDFKSV